MADPFDPSGAGYRDAGSSPHAGSLLFGSSQHKDSLLYGAKSGELVLFAYKRMVPNDTMFYLDLVIEWDTGRDLDICVWFNISRAGATSVELGTFGYGQTYNRPDREATAAFGSGTASGTIWGKYYGDNTSSHGSETVRIGIPGPAVDPQGRGWVVRVECHYATIYYGKTGGQARAMMYGGGKSANNAYTPSPKEGDEGDRGRAATKSDAGGTFLATIGRGSGADYGRIIVRNIEKVD